MKKNKSIVLFVIIKGICAAAFWQLGLLGIFYLPLSFISTETINLLMIIGLLIYGLILRNNSWLKVLISWCVSVVFCILMLLPQMFDIPQFMYDFSASSLYMVLLFFALKEVLITYIISTFISTLVVMLAYKFIQKKRMEKHLHDTDNSHDDREV